MIVPGLGLRPDGAMETPCGILPLPGLRPLRITGGIDLLPPGVGLLRDCCPRLRESRRRRVLGASQEPYINRDRRGCSASIV